MGFLDSVEAGSQIDSYRIDAPGGAEWHGLYLSRTRRTCAISASWH